MFLFFRHSCKSRHGQILKVVLYIRFSSVLLFPTLAHIFWAWRKDFFGHFCIWPKLWLSEPCLSTHLRVHPLFHVNICFEGRFCGYPENCLPQLSQRAGFLCLF